MICHPLLDLTNAPVHIITNLVYPKAFHVPTKFKHALISQLIAITEFTVPLLMVHFSIYFDVKLPSVIENDSQIKLVFFYGVLRDGLNPCIIESGIEDSFPIRYLFRICNPWVFSALCNLLY